MVEHNKSGLKWLPAVFDEKDDLEIYLLYCLIPYSLDSRFIFAKFKAIITLHIQLSSQGFQLHTIIFEEYQPTEENVPW